MKAIRPARALAALTLAWIATATATAAESETWVLRAARYVDVEAGRVLAPAVLVVAGPRIVALNPPSLPAGARTLELPGLTLLPGFIDDHTHLGSDLGPGWERRGVEWTAVDCALLGVRYARETLLSGFTTVRDVGSVGFSDVALMHAVERGDIVGPRIVPAGHGIGITGGHCDSTGYAPDVLEAGPRQGVADGPDELVAAVRYQIKHGSLLDAQAIAVLKKHGTWLVPTLYQWFESYELPPLLHEKNEYIKARIGGSMREAFKAGVKVALGTDAGAGPHGHSGKEFTAYVAHGMAPADAIRAGTMNAAELLGLGDRLGRLQPGLLADVVAVPGNPLEDIRVLEDVRFVVRDGQVYKRP